MNSLRKLWMWWQLEALRAQFPYWDIIRRERDVFGVDGKKETRSCSGCGGTGKV